MGGCGRKRSLFKKKIGDERTRLEGRSEAPRRPVSVALNVVSLLRGV